MEHVKSLLQQNHHRAIAGLGFGARNQATTVNWIFVGFDVVQGTYFSTCDAPLPDVRCSQTHCNLICREHTCMAMHGTVHT